MQPPLLRNERLVGVVDLVEFLDVLAEDFGDGIGRIDGHVTADQKLAGADHGRNIVNLPLVGGLGDDLSPESLARVPRSLASLSMQPSETERTTLERLTNISVTAAAGRARWVKTKSTCLSL